MPRLIVSIFLHGTILLTAGAAFSLDYPNKPVRIVTSAPGGANDFAARIISQGLASALGQHVIVDNRASIIAPEIAVKAPPDGYTLHLNASNFWIGPLIRKTPYDPVRDFSPITLLARAPLVLVVHPAVPVNSVKELIGLAKSKPGELNYAASERGSTNQLAGELFKSTAGVNIVAVNYQSAGAGIISMLGGQVQLMFAGAGGVAPHVKSGKLRALAITGAQPSTLFPGLPTVAATAPGYEFTSKYGMWAPARTPETITKRLNQEIVRVLNRADVKERFFNAGVDVVGSSPKEFAAVIKSDMAILGKVIKDANLRLD